jgi:glycosyltransferase involved in cell wall biosynthesis
LVRAFALLRSRLGCDIELWMFGHEHQNEGPAEAWARQRSLEAGIRFLGPLPHAECLTKLAEQVDIFVHPSLEEAHSMAVTEAMAIGLPVIGGKYSGGISWTLADGKAGLLVDVTSPRSIADGMHAIAKQADLRRRLGLAGRELALSQYHIDTTVSSYETILDRASKEQIQ